MAVVRGLAVEHIATQVTHIEGHYFGACIPYTMVGYQVLSAGERFVTLGAKEQQQ